MYVTQKKKTDPLLLFLVAIAKHYGFDGWLMNIECSFVPFPTPVQTKAQQLTW
jgi:endo-beta-N-acetylglucosaminidase D